jgi:hypothetical protein
MRPRSIPIEMTVGERAARSKGEYMERGSDWEIPFNVFVDEHWHCGILSPNIHRLPCGLSGEFLVYLNGSFKTVIRWTGKQWEMEETDQDFVWALGEYITAWYE